MVLRTLAQMVPLHRRDQLMLTIFVIGVPFSVWFELSIVMPTYQVSIWNSAHYTFCLIAVMQVYWNLFYMLRIDTSINILTDLQSIKFEKNCEKCGPVPPRSHHCKLCDICIIKRDHHCWFAGSCTGLTNHRYYIMVILYCWLAGTYASIYHLNFMISTLGLSYHTLIGLVAPHLLLVFGYFTLYEFFITAVWDISIYLMILLSWLLKNQIMQIINGQTPHEQHKGISSYSKSLTENIHEVLGNRWYMTVLSPSISSHLPDQSEHWRKCKTD